ncbi:helix-turn-helix transcriptional regulator [Streptomyces sp. B5E4]|uniref:PadR family transcriptional regulator n=1 Tax=Streptomyces sp. B5E4 TaxID=3153568 RepID=UPI00325DA022
MPPVFAHGRLRLYLLKLLDEAPRHGYEVIRLLEERFQGLYAPSAGTVYPRLAKLETEGLVTHTSEGGRKVYAITEAGRAELAARQAELAELELEIRDSVAELAAEIQADVSGTASDLRREMRQAAKEARTSGGANAGEKESWRQAKEEFKRAKQEFKEQARRAKDETRRARQDAEQARKHARETQERVRSEAERIARQVQEQVQTRVRTGDWQGGLMDGLAELTRELGNLGGFGGRGTETEAESGTWTDAGTKSGNRPRAGGDSGTGPEPTTPSDRIADAAAPTPPHGGMPTATGTTGVGGIRTPWPSYVKPDPADTPEWAEEDTPQDATPAELARELERLLDRFRDDVRDAARDNGVSPDQLRGARRHLSTAAAHLTALLRAGVDRDGDRDGKKD